MMKCLESVQKRIPGLFITVDVCHDLPIQITRGSYYQRPISICRFKFIIAHLCLEVCIVDIQDPEILKSQSSRDRLFHNTKSMAIPSERAGAFQNVHLFTAADGGQSIVLLRSPVNERPRNADATRVHFYLLSFFAEPSRTISASPYASFDFNGHPSTQGLSCF